jgi:hypothetical protein
VAFFPHDQAGNIVSLAAHYRGDADEIRGTRRFLAGVGVSVALHVMLVFGYRGIKPVPLPAEPAQPTPIAVRILPPRPPRVEATPQPRAAPAPARSAPKSTPKPVIDVPATPQGEAAPDTFSVQQAGEPAPGEAPQFSMDAAKQTARQLAHQTKLGREGTAVAQFPDPPLETESKFAKAISKAKRRDCKDGVPGGLLAPLFLLMDKKDSGCKW